MKTNFVLMLINLLHIIIGLAADLIKLFKKFSIVLNKIDGLDKMTP